MLKKWQELIQEVYQNPEKLQLVAEQFAQQFIIDRNALDSNQLISSCAIDAPQLNTVVDKQIGLAHQIASVLYPFKTDDNLPLSTDKSIHTVSDKVGRYVLYRRLIGRLRQAYRQQIAPPEKPKYTIYQLARLNGDRAVYYQLKQDKTISDVVAKPEPMSVTVSPLAQLEPFFSFLQEQDLRSIENQDQDFVSFVRGTQFADGRMDMCKQVVGSPWIDKLMASIKDNQQIKHFLLGNNIIGLQGAKAIAQFLETQPNSPIETWYLAGNNIDSQGIKLIADKLTDDRKVKALWLKRNPLGVEGVRHLADMLKTNNSLQILDLHNTATFDRGVEYLFEALKSNHSLDSLYLDGNGITGESAPAMAEYFDYLAESERVGLSTLYLTINRLGDEGVVTLAKSVSRYPYLKRLSLGANRIEAQAGQEILRLLINHPSLIYLDLGAYKATSDMGELPNNMGDEVVPMLCQFIRQNQKLQGLSIRDNNISVAGLETIVGALEDNQNLFYFKYEQFGLKIPASLITRIDRQLERNVRLNLGISWAEFKENHQRYIKHNPEVRNIDSIYRNRACTLA